MFIKLANHYFYLGLALLFMFVVQDALSLKMAWLEYWQQQQSFKIYSGLLLLGYLFMQFVMPYNKLCKTPHISRGSSYRQHKYYGALAPLLFFIHATTWGVAYLGLLSTVYFTHFLFGLFNYEQVKNSAKQRIFFKIWLPIHIILALMLMTLVGFHLYVVASY